MILIKKLLIGTLLSAFVLDAGIYDYSVPKIEGGNKALSDFQGKKIMIITLPVQQSAVADTLLYCLDTLASAHLTDLAVIAVPSYEDGYTTGIKDELKLWYRSKLGNYITITEGLYTSKTSANQDALFNWLTHLSSNSTFDNDTEGPGHKFFVRANGELYGMLVPQTKVSSKAVQKTLQMP